MDDHRKKVAARRRERMRRRLVEAAVLVFAAKPHDEVVIEDIVAEADVARGTFYKYFDRLEDLLMAAKAALGEEILSMVLAEDAGVDDPALALATDIRRFVATCRRYRIIGLFSIRIGAGPAELIEDKLPAYIGRGTRSGRFCAVPDWLVASVLKMAVMPVLTREAGGEADAEDEVEAVAAVLRCLGIPPREAAALAREPGRPLTAPPDTLIARADAIRRGQDGAPAG